MYTIRKLLNIPKISIIFLVNEKKIHIRLGPYYREKPPVHTVEKYIRQDIMARIKRL